MAGKSVRESKWVDWNRYTDGRVKGVKFMSKTNEVTVMLPAGGTNSGGG